MMTKLTVKAVLAGLSLAVLLPAYAVAQQQPSEPGWPQPMNNNPLLGYAILNQNELRTGNGNDTYRWEGEGWYGGNLNRAWFKTEGNLNTKTGTLEEGEGQALYSRAITKFFDLQTGVRYDVGQAPSRGWAVFGVQGLAPYFFELGAYGFVSTGGHMAARLETSYDLMLTQRLVLQPQAEVNFYTKSDALRGVGSGLSDLDAGLRLRYEFSRKFAPYIGVTYESKFGKTADFARASGETVHQVRFVFGIRAWL